MKIQNKLEENPIIDDKYTLWDAQVVKNLIGWKSNTGLYSAMEKQDFPRPVKFGSRKALWVKTEVLAWLDERIADRDDVKQQ